MALDMTPEQKTIGEQNFHRVVGKLGMNRRQFMQGMLAAGAAVPLSAAAYFGYSNSGFSGRPVKAGLIGAGDEGGVLVGEHNPQYVEFVAYSEIRPTNQRRIFVGEPTGPRRGFNHHYGNDARNRIRLYENYRDLLADPEIEMVVIALPLNLHAQASIEAMEAGKHVLCEKLMAWNIRQCKRMIRAADRTNKLLSIGHQRHYSLLYAHAVEVMNAGTLGDVKHIRALWHRNNALRPTTETINGRNYTRYGNDSWRKPIPEEDRAALESRLGQFAGNWRDMNQLVRWRLFQKTGGGLMAELGSHQLDACSIFLGKKKPLAVMGYGGKHFYQDDREVEDHVYCTFEFPGANYDAREHARARDAEGRCLYNDLVTVTYSSISTNSFEPYGECVMGNQGTMVTEGEKSIMIWGSGGRGTSVTAGAGGMTSMDTSASNDPVERRAAAVGQESIGHAPPSRGYREEMEHLAYLIRTRGEGTERDERQLKPRCDGRAAMADAILALGANAAMRTNRRIEFDPRWFEVNADEAADVLPDWDLPE